MNWNIDNTNKQFKPDTQWMSEKYNEMNQKLFNNNLGDCHFDIFTSGKGSQGRTLGFFELRRQTFVNRYTQRMYAKKEFSENKIEVNKNNFVELCRPKIALNGNYTGTEYAFLNTLVHEMCHYYTYMYGIAPTQAHGREFRYISDIICGKSNGFFVIQRLATAEEMDNFVLSDEMKEKQTKREENKKSNITAIFDFKTNGEVRLTTTSNQSLIDKICNYQNRITPSKKIILSKDPNLISFLFEKGYKANFRIWKYWNVGNEDWLKKLNDMNVKVINFDNSFNESKKMKITNEIINEVLNKYLESKSNDNFIEINPGMNLGLESPLE